MSTEWIYKLIRRTLDILVSTTGLLLLSLLSPVVALMNRLTSPGPLFYKSKRIGKNGEPFEVLKFRTMVPNAESSRLEFSWQLQDDPRLTHMGRFLRKTYLDELPQVINVLRGEMSVIGPRAELPWVAKKLQSLIPDYDLRHSVKPGLTGWAQVSLPVSSPLVQPELVFDYDLKYIQHRSLLLDLKIIGRTLLFVLGLDSVFANRPITLGRAPLDSEWSQVLSSILNNDRERFSLLARDIAQYIGNSIDLKLTSWQEKSDRIEAFSFDTSIAFHNTKLPRTLPVLLLFDTELRRTDLPELHRLLLSPSGSGYHVGLLLFFGDHLSLQSAVGLLEASMRVAYACDVVVLGLEELQSLLLQRDPHSKLRQIILSSVDLLSVSPFIVTGPASDTMFFGREQELREITEHAKAASYAIIGGRRIGKSSLLTRLHRDRLPNMGLRTLYFACSTTSTYDEVIRSPIRDRDWQPRPPSDAPVVLGELLHSTYEDKPSVLLLDEADKLVPTERANDWPLFGALRSIASSGRVQVILSGERTLRDALRDPKSPLFNFANEILLGPLDYRAVEELVTQPMKQLEIELENEKALVDRIWAFTSGHPNVVQRLCRRLIERLNEQDTRRITLNDVDAVIEDSRFQRDDFLSTYWEAATPLEKIISLLMADDAEVRTLGAARQALEERCDLHPSAREIDNALQRLVDLRSILKRTLSGYEFAVKAFPRVVAGKMTLNDMLMILTEEYEEQSE